LKHFRLDPLPAPADARIARVTAPGRAPVLVFRKPDETFAHFQDRVHEAAEGVYGAVVEWFDKEHETERN
jgi:hypothetical protein